MVFQTLTPDICRWYFSSGMHRPTPLLSREGAMKVVVQDVHRATPEQMARKHVFVLNGSSEFLGIVRQLLEDERYNVTTSNFVPSSFETVVAAQPSLLIVDLVIGELAGWELLVQVRNSESTSTIPTLLMSTAPKLLDKAKEEHDEFGGDKYLSKPFDLEDLLKAVVDLIGPA
ncbi:MAG: response regulator [Thermomicrobiales bacterium]